MPIAVDEKLLEFCKNEREKEIIGLLLSGWQQKDVASHILADVSTVRRLTKRVRERAALQGHSPENDMTKVSPDPFMVKGTSTLYGKDGDVKLQWVKTNVKYDAIVKVIEDTVEALAESVQGMYIPTVKPNPQSFYIDQCMTVYPMGDPHIGMFAWKDESGEDFDCKIAERHLTNAVRYLTHNALPTRTCLIANLGDFFHSDNMSNRTSRSGNPLDVDTRWAKVFRIGVNILVKCIQSALEKHETVYVINEIGNHDDHTSYALSVVLESFFHDEPRVVIDTSPSGFHYHRFGEVFIGITHGDKIKYADLGPIMATDKASDWGECKHRYWYVGHVHHDQKKEYHGCLVESFRTLAAKDAWHSAHGYRSGRDMKSITLHKEYGEIERKTVNVEMLDDLMQQ